MSCPVKLIQTQGMDISSILKQIQNSTANVDQENGVNAAARQRCIPAKILWIIALLIFAFVVFGVIYIFNKYTDSIVS